MSESAIISKVWGFANVLRDDGVSYGDYLEQITYLLFLKMADELNKPPYNKGLKFPKLKNAEGEELPEAETCDWQTLSQKRGLELENFTTKCSEVWVLKKAFWGKFSPKVKTKYKTHPSS
jgi:type I restriction enzyme M protein